MSSPQKRKHIVEQLKLLLLFTAVISSGLAASGGYGQSVYNWSGLANGINGNVYAIVKRGDDIVVGGKFTMGGINNVAVFDGSNWLPLGVLPDSVTALIEFNAQLVAASGNRVVQWDGSNWFPLGGVFNSRVNALTVFRNNLVAGGAFTNNGLNYIASWNGSAWLQLSNGLGNEVLTLTVDSPGLSGILYVGGRFTTAGGNSANYIAKWDVTQWSPLGSGTTGPVRSLVYRNSQLIVGGDFNAPGNHIARWDSASAIWDNPFGTIDSSVLSLTYYNNQLIAGGSFKYAGGNYVDRIAKWDGAAWTRLITGMNTKVNILYPAIVDTNKNLYAGGFFTTAGGKYISHVALWNLQEAVTISGIVRYGNDSTLVPSGRVRAVRIDVNTREIIIVDSTSIINGNYTLVRIPKRDTLFVVCFPDDEFLDQGQRTFIPTYYSSTIDWQAAVRLIPQGNLSNINIYVTRITPNPINALITNMSGHVFLNFTPPFVNSVEVGFPYKSGAIIYAREGSYYRNYAVSNTLESYMIQQLQPGTYDLYVNRIGYTSATRTVTLGNVNIDTIDFYLDTVSLIGIQTISTEVPKEFRLEQNYPNPFNAETVIRYQLSVNSFVSLKVYDLLGREVQTLVSEQFRPGIYQVSWDASNLASGVYVYRLQAGDFAESKRMVLIK
jgi:hypothetical protein